MPSPRSVAALGVHVLTASGALFALLALQAAYDRFFEAMFLWLAIAAIVDGIDGPLARKLDIAHTAPRYDGSVLDLVVDYATYVLVPAFGLMVSNRLPEGYEALACGVLCVTAAIYFADTRMKTDDAWFRGFPAVWNVVVFYLLVFPLDPWPTFAVVIVFAVLQFVPVPFVHPLRVRLLRPVTLALLAAWMVAGAAALWFGLRPPVWAQAILLGAGVWFLALGVLRRA